MRAENRIAEEEKHDELNAAEGIYNRLNKARFGFYENGRSMREYERVGSNRLMTILKI